jgi:hypothetical protein
VALVFELVINAGPDREAADGIGATLTGLAPLPAGRHRVALHPPLIRPLRGEDGTAYHEISLVPVGVGVKVARDVGVPPLLLDPDELRELGNGLYEVLRTCRGYRAAIVGWDPEQFVDLAELAGTWADEARAGELSGLVLSDDAVHDLTARGVEVTVEPFAPGASWMPYRGSRLVHQPVDRWTFSDAWILAALAVTDTPDRDTTLAELMAAADGVNHAYPTDPEIQQAVARLTGTGLLTAGPDTFRLTEAGRAFVARRRGGAFGQVDSLLALLGAVPLRSSPWILPPGAVQRTRRSRRT